MARFMGVLYHLLAPDGESGEVGAYRRTIGESMEAAAAAVTATGERLCYLTSFHLGAHETLFCSPAFVCPLVVRFPSAIRWECGVFRFDASHLRISRRSRRDSHGIALPGCAGPQAGGRASADSHPSSAHGGHRSKTKRPPTTWRRNSATPGSTPRSSNTKSG